MILDCFYYTTLFLLITAVISTADHVNGWVEFKDKTSWVTRWISSLRTRDVCLEFGRVQERSAILWDENERKCGLLKLWSSPNTYLALGNGVSPSDNPFAIGYMIPYTAAVDGYSINNPCQFWYIEYNRNSNQWENHCARFPGQSGHSIYLRDTLGGVPSSSS